MFASPIVSYQQVGLESDIRGADPHHLIVLLFDGVDAALAHAQSQLVNNDLVGKTESLNKAISIILDGLSASLNIEAGGELSQNLAALYDYMVRRLIHANIQKDSAAIREVQGLIGEIGGAWREMGENLKKNVGDQNS